MKILTCASEVVPYAKTGGLADVAGALPLALEELGHEVIITMPRYKAVNAQKANLQSLKEGISYAILGKNIKVYFIENEKYYFRDGLYGDKNGDYPDNLERFSFYSKKTLELIKELNFKPDIMHCHDWQSALVNIYLKNLYKNEPFYAGIKTLFTIHNIGYQGLFSKEEFPKLGLDWSLFNMEGLEFYGKVNLLKGGLIFTDAMNTVSKAYSQEIQTKEFGFGLEGILKKRRDSLFGIINGLDYSIWNPATDGYIFKKYSLDSLEDKYENKRGLQKLLHLPVEDVPLFGMVSRLAEQKGLDIFAEGIEKFCRLNLQLVLLGTGDMKYHIILEEVAKKYPNVASIHLKFDDSLAHKIYAGGDIFLMPSKYEPCGLGQMISLAYGTVPLVFKTGGLADTITKDNGFVFDRYTKDDFLKTVKQAISAYRHKKTWLDLVKTGLHCNFSWQESAKKYVDLYARLLKK